MTDPGPHMDPPRAMKKRIIVCCDGTWEDGISTVQAASYTNVLRIARAINHVDIRSGIAISQVVFYQSGMGSSNNLYSKVVDGVTGASLGDKVEEAYAFISQNYAYGDEISLFGFSRGAYIARIVADFIGAIGILDRTQMDNFAGIFVAFQRRGKTTDPNEKRTLDEQLAPWMSDNSLGKKRVDVGLNGFSIKCVGVFDTVGSVGLPEEISIGPEIRTVFGFNDRILGEHVECAYQALAVNEMRKDFDCSRFHQTETGRQKGQVLKQCWFTGCHSDIGGGYKHHDLSDLTLTWMAANVCDKLSLSTDYIKGLCDPVAPWGELPAHNSIQGIYKLAATAQRKLPTAIDTSTHERIHPSVLRQRTLVPDLVNDLDEHPDLVCSLLPLEEELKKHWPYYPGREQSSEQSGPLSKVVTSDGRMNQAVSDILDGHREEAETAQLNSEASQKPTFMSLVRDVLL